MSVFKTLKVKETVEKKNYCSSFLFKNLPVNSAITLGTYLRRVLLDYIPGIAPLGIKIADKNGPVKTYFDVLHGVAKTGTVAHLVSNLKKIVLIEKKPKNGVFCLELNVENKENKERIITVDDFKGEDIIIQYPQDLKSPLLTLSPALKEKPNKLEIKLYYQKNWGHHRVDEQQQYEEAIREIKKYFPDDENIIVFSTNYSPVKEVNSQEEEKAIIDLIENEEENLKLTITTNGVIKPKEALLEALKVAEDSFTVIKKFLIDEPKKSDEETENLN